MFLLRSNGKSGNNGTLSWILAPSVTLVALTASSQSQSLSEVSLTYLQRHGVPCQSVVKVDSTDNMDEVAICQDGREWVLFWLEDEVAFVRPGSRQFYRWRPDLNSSFPYLYERSERISEIQGGGADGSSSGKK
jgi:hypothetical protein